MNVNIITAFSVIAIWIGVIQKITYLMVYLYVYGINFDRLRAYFNKMPDDAEEQEEHKLILPEEEDVKSSNEVEEESVASVEEDEAEDEDMETLYVYDFEGTGEQLRRLRAYNPILADETADEYASRIWSMAYQEDKEEEETRKVLSSVLNLEAESANEIVAEVASSSVADERDVNTWYTIEDGKCRYKGEWMNGLPNGKGIKHFYKTDSYIDGNFVDGFAEGYGKQTFEQTWEKTQPYYAGEFKRNKYNGKGEYHYGDGHYYKGMWKDGNYHGQGAAYSLRLDRTWVGEYCNDEKVEGNWVRGEI